MRTQSTKVPPKPTFPPDASAYGGALFRTRSGRSRGRPVSTTRTMHVVLRSEKAKGIWSFKHQRNERHVIAAIRRHSKRFDVKVFSLANVGNHLHLHVQFPSRNNYLRFIRAVTAAIAMAVTGSSRWRPNSGVRTRTGHGKKKEKFWSGRPFSRIVKTAKAFLTLKDYIAINHLEGLGFAREVARMVIKNPSRNRIDGYG